MQCPVLASTRCGGHSGSVFSGGGGETFCWSSISPARCSIASPVYTCERCGWSLQQSSLTFISLIRTRSLRAQFLAPVVPRWRNFFDVSPRALWLGDDMGVPAQTYDFDFREHTRHLLVTLLGPISYPRLRPIPLRDRRSEVGTVCRKHWPTAGYSDRLRHAPPALLRFLPVASDTLPANTRERSLRRVTSSARRTAGEPGRPALVRGPPRQARRLRSFGKLRSAAGFHGADVGRRTCVL